MLYPVAVRFVFVGGCARSGTTLVQKLLTLHSTIAGGPEFDHTRALIELYARMVDPFHLDRQKAFYDERLLRENFRRFYEGFFESRITRKPEARFVAEKTPDNVFVAQHLLTVFPGSVFVNVVRDGRDVVVSHDDVRRRHERNDPNHDTSGFKLRPVVELWNSCISTYFDLAALPEFQPRLRLVRFEKLVENPRAEIEELLAFLGLALEPDLLQPERFDETRTEAVTDGIWYTPEMYRQAFNTDRVGRWRTELGWLEKRRARRLMRYNLKRLGYPT